MDAGALKVLHVVVMRLLGLEGGKPHNADTLAFVAWRVGAWP